jgi:hypothetical protein
MNKEKKIGMIYEFCASCSACPVAVEAKVEGKGGIGN